MEKENLLLLLKMYFVTTCYVMVYIEPYAGGSAVALTLLLEGFAWNVIINDIDKRVYAFWWSILNETDGLLRMIYNSDVNIKIWEKQKLIH